MSTWISLAERPPPADVTRPRLLLRFRTARTRETSMGYYLGDGKVHILGRRVADQLPLNLDDFTDWQPVNERQLAEIEGHG